MNKRTTALSIAAILAASSVAVYAQSYSGSSDPKGVPGVEMNVGKNANDGGLPGVEMNVGRDGDQKNIDTKTSGAGTDKTTMDGKSTMRPMRKDRG
ncbi:MAG TPA: hypothetical protein VF522_06275 [Ramlibacter sp.]|uniref:hypothetical protein n=1 Tax=Ramlibacter sp. TaxID=1917967 RepID=UPI002ED00BD2